MPDFDDPDQEAKDHGNLMDEGVAEVEREAAEAAGGQDHMPAGQAAKSLPPTDRPTGAAAFSEAQKARTGPSVPTESKGGSREQGAELLAEQIAEAQDSAT